MLEDTILSKEKDATALQESLFGKDGTLMKKRLELIQPIQKKVFDAINAYAQSHGYDLVLDSASNPTLLYNAPKLDQTEGVAFVAGSTSVFAQKLGRINMQELVFAMPETAEMQKNLEAYQKELQDQLETIGVEFNNKLNEYTKQVSDKNSTMSDSVRQLKEKELNDLKTRYDEFVQVSQQDMQKKQGELLEPIIVKAQDAVKEVSKAGGYTVVYDTSVNAVAYFDEAVVTDILPAVKTKLGIKDTPAAAPAAPAAK